MKLKKLLGIFFFLTLITTTVFGFTAENSRQGFDGIFTGLHQGVTLSKTATAPGVSACFLESSRQVFLLAQGGKELTKGAIIEGFEVGNHAWRKAGLGKGATEEMVRTIIQEATKAGTIVTESGAGKFAGNVIKKFLYNGAEVVVDTTRKIIITIKSPSGFKF